MELKYGNNGKIGKGKRRLSKADLIPLREFCEREGEAVAYHKGERLEQEGSTARWLAYVTEGCFKYVTHDYSETGQADEHGKEHITWFSFEGEFVVDYPTFLYGHPAETSIEAMMPSRVLRVTGEQLERFFEQNMETMRLRAFIAEHILSQFRSRYLDMHRTKLRERYLLLLQRCPGIVNELSLSAIASFLHVTPQMLSRVRKEITFGIE